MVFFIFILIFLRNDFSNDTLFDLQKNESDYY